MKTIGVLGGGQLARMLALAGTPMGMRFVCIDPNPNCPASHVASVIPLEFHQTEAIQHHFHAVDCITFETENLPISTISPLANHYPIFPNLNALQIMQDRFLEKNFLNTLSIPTPKYRDITDWQDLEDAITTLNFPVLLKTRRQGYDGKGQFKLTSWEQAKDIWITLSSSNPMIAEEWITYDREVSLILARNTAGEIILYPLTYNEHEQGILRVSHAPYRDEILEQLAEQYAQRIVADLDYVGVMAIEFFCVNNQLLVNEIAPRVHNSGHWTIEGAVTSQFENHVRAITGLPLGSPEPRGFSAMINCIGHEPKNITELLHIPGVHLHSYGKEARPLRKLGHLTICANDPKTVSQHLKEVQRFMP